MANVVEFRRSKIVRMVKSSLAAEGNSLSAAADEQLHLCLLVQAFWRGPPEITTSWKEDLKVPGLVATDAKALFGH